MSLDDCKAKHTHRQMLAFNRWLDDQMNNPGSLEHYVMQNTQHLRMILNVFAKAKFKLGFDDLKINWSRTEVDEPAIIEGPIDYEAVLAEMTDEERQEIAEQQKKRFGFLGKPVAENKS